jgi:hypothetical protein
MSETPPLSRLEMGEGWGEYLRVVIRDGEPVFQLRCPGCGVWGDLDDDQLHGRVSTEHSAGSDDRGYASSSGCGFHETRDWFSEAAQDTGGAR